MSAINFPIQIHGLIDLSLSAPQLLFAMWVTIGLLALVVGLIAVRVSTRQLLRVTRPAAQAPQGDVRATA